MVNPSLGPPQLDLNHHILSLDKIFHSQIYAKKYIKLLDHYKMLLGSVSMMDIPIHNNNSSN